MLDYLLFLSLSHTNIYIYIVLVCVCRVDTAGKVLALHRCRLRLSRSSAENPEFTLSSVTIVRASKSRTGVQVSFMRGTKNVMRTSPVNNKIADKKPSFWGMVLLHDHFFLSGELHWYVLQATTPARTWRNFRPTSLKNTDEQNSHQKILLTVDSWFKHRVKIFCCLIQITEWI